MNGRLYKTFSLLPLVLALLSCTPVPVPHPYFPCDLTVVTEHDVETLAFKAITRKDVIDKLGRPLWYRKNEISYLVCRRNEGGVIWGFGGTVVTPDCKPRCNYSYYYCDELVGAPCNEFILAFDAQDTLLDFRKMTATWPPDATAAMQAEDINLRELGRGGDPIAQRLWEESITFERQSPAEWRSQAENGSANVQYRFHFKDKQAPLKWLCRAADQGHTGAEMRLGYLFETGNSYGVSVDYAQSYLWYRRAAISHSEEIDSMIEMIQHSALRDDYCRNKSKNCTIAQKIVELKDKLGDEGISRAEMLFEQWKPGECEKSFLTIQPLIDTE